MAAIYYQYEGKWFLLETGLLEYETVIFKAYAEHMTEVAHKTASVATSLGDVMTGHVIVKPSAYRLEYPYSR